MIKDTPELGDPVSDRALTHNPPMTIKRLPRMILSRLTRHGPLLCAVLTSAAYAAVWLWIDYLQYASFNLHIFDLGVDFAAPYLTSQGHFQFEPQAWIYLVYVPIFAAFPSPFTMVAVEVLLEAVSGLGVFLVACEVLQDAWKAYLIATMYLFFYAFAGAPFFPGHYEVLFSFFFSFGYYFHLRSYKALSAVFLSLSAISSLLAAVTVLFVFLVIVGPEGLASAKSGLRAIWRLLRRNADLASGAGTSVVAGAIATLGFGVTGIVSAGHISQAGQGGIVSGMFVNDPLKMAYFLFLLVPFGSSIFRSRLSIALLPFIFLIVVSPFDHYAMFYYQYSYDVGALLFIAFIDSLSGSPPQAGQATRAGRIRRLNRDSSNTRILRAGVVLIVLGAFILPIGPMNHLLGLESDSLPFWDVGLGNVTDVTPYDHALADMINQIPLTSTVLGQETMPQICNRAHYYEPGSYDGEAVNYVVTDPQSWSFSFIPPSFIGPFNSSMEHWFNYIYSNGTYGIKDEYQGAILLERGYSGPPALFSPEYFRFVGPDLRGNTQDGARLLNGSWTVNNQTDGSWFVDSQLHLLTLPPGTFTASFTLAERDALNASHMVVGVSYGSSGTSLAARVVSGANFTSAGSSQTFDVTFRTIAYVTGVYVTIYSLSWRGSLTLDRIALNQVA